jgi:hypothetical protein
MEIKREAGVEYFWMYETSRFLEHASRAFNTDIDNESVEEVKLSSIAVSNAEDTRAEWNHQFRVFPGVGVLGRAPINIYRLPHAPDAIHSDGGRDAPRHQLIYPEITTIELLVDHAIDQWARSRSRLGELFSINTEGVPRYVYRSASGNRALQVITRIATRSPELQLSECLRTASSFLSMEIVLLDIPSELGGQPFSRQTIQFLEEAVKVSNISYQFARMDEEMQVLA